MINTEMFPYENHPYRLEFGEKKNPTVCYFSCEEHLQKYLNRYRLDKKTIKIDYRDGEPSKSDKTDKNNIQQGTRKTPSRSTSRSKGSAKKLDSAGTPSRTRKSKPKPKSK